jgi:hypothetical protein
MEAGVLGVELALPVVLDLDLGLDSHVGNNVRVFAQSDPEKDGYGKVLVVEEGPGPGGSGRHQQTDE